MMIHHMLRSAVATLGVMLALQFSGAGAASAAPTWDTIAKNGVVRVGVIPNRPPYFWQEGGKWVGFSAQMGQDLAKDLSAKLGKEIKVEFVLTSWTTVILDIQADKIDAFFGLSFSEERKKAINLAGPIYSLPNVALNAAGLKVGGTWDDYN